MLLVYTRRKVVVGGPGAGIVLLAVFRILFHSERESMASDVSLHGDGCMANTWWVRCRFQYAHYNLRLRKDIFETVSLFFR